MNDYSPQYADQLKSLPTSDFQPAQSELDTIKSIFKTTKVSTFSKLLLLKDGLVIAVTFILISLPFVSNILRKFIPETSYREYLIILIKTVVLVTVYILYKQFFH